MIALKLPQTHTPTLTLAHMVCLLLNPNNANNMFAAGPTHARKPEDRPARGGLLDDWVRGLMMLMMMMMFDDDDADDDDV